MPNGKRRAVECKIYIMRDEVKASESLNYTSEFSGHILTTENIVLGQLFYFPSSRDCLSSPLQTGKIKCPTDFRNHKERE